MVIRHIHLYSIPILDLILFRVLGSWALCINCAYPQKGCVHHVGMHQNKRGIKVCVNMHTLLTYPENVLPSMQTFSVHSIIQILKLI